MSNEFSRYWEFSTVVGRRSRVRYELWVIEFFCILDRRRSALGYGLRRDETPARSLGSGCATTDVTYQFPGFSGHRRASDAFASRLSPISWARELKLCKGVASGTNELAARTGLAGGRLRRSAGRTRNLERGAVGGASGHGGHGPLSREAARMPQRAASRSQTLVSNGGGVKSETPLGGRRHI